MTSIVFTYKTCTQTVFLTKRFTTNQFKPSWYSLWNHWWLFPVWSGLTRSPWNYKVDDYFDWTPLIPKASAGWSNHQKKELTGFASLLWRRRRLVDFQTRVTTKKTHHYFEKFWRDQHFSTRREMGDEKWSRHLHRNSSCTYHQVMKSTSLCKIKSYHCQILPPA